MTNIEQTIKQVEKLYQKVTGQPVPGNTTAYAPLQTNIDPAQQVQKNMETLLHTLQNPQIMPQTMYWTPAIALWEGEKEFILRMDLPAVKTEDIDISVEGHSLHIRGVRRSFDQDQQLHPLHMENVVGPFQRTIELPAFVNTSKVDSKIIDGVLHISIAKGATNSTTTKTKKA